jgi:hypothetical protein
MAAGSEKHEGRCKYTPRGGPRVAAGSVLFRTPVVGVNPLLSADGARTPQGGLSMSVVWIVVGIAAVVAVAKLVGSLRERAWESDLGFVSHQWITEHRLSQTSESQR